MTEYYFLLAGGLGTRTRPLSNYKPKPVFPLAGTPLIRIMLEQLYTQGISQGFVNTHHLAAQVEAAVSGYPDVTVLYEAELSGSKIIGTAATSMASDDLLWVVNGDIFIDIDFDGMKAAFLNSGCDGFLLARRREPGYPALMIDHQTNLLLGREKIFSAAERRRLAQGGPEIMYTGVAIFNRKLTAAINEINFFDSFEKRLPGSPLFQADREPLRIGVFLHNSIWLDIGDPESYKAANRAYTDFKRIPVPNGNSLSPGVEISAEATVSDCIIWDNVRITGASVVKDCIVTDGVTLDGAQRTGKILTS